MTLLDELHLMTILIIAWDRVQQDQLHEFLACEWEPENQSVFSVELGDASRPAVDLKVIWATS